MKLPIALLGAGGHARVVLAVLKRLGCTVVGCIDEINPVPADMRLDGVPVAAPAALSRWGGPDTLALHVAIGHNATRLGRIEILRAQGWALPVVIDPSAVVEAPEMLGAGSFVAPQAVINPGARLGAGVIVNSGAVVEHDCRIGDGVHLAPRSVLGGHATVGALSLIGMGSVIRDRATVGTGVVLGAGSLVLKSIPDHCTAYGVPATVRPPMPER